MAKFIAILFNYIKILTHSVILVLRNVEDVNISRTRCVFLRQGCHIFRHRNVRNYDCFCRTTFNVASRHPCRHFLSTWQAASMWEVSTSFHSSFPYSVFFPAYCYFMIVESRSMESGEEETQLGVESEDENSELSDSEVRCCHANIS